jgi:uncharacterized iron-regulated membrane protein
MSDEQAPKEDRPRHAAKSRIAHSWLVAAHRYLGLSIAIVLFVEAVTGSIAVFKNELDAAINPTLCYCAAPSAEATALEPLVLRARIDEQLPKGLSTWELPLTPPAAGYAIDVNLNWDGKPLAREVDTAYANPYTGELLGLRNHAISASWRNLIPFIFEIHYSLALGDLGNWLLGLTAVLWTVDCFVALYLTFPPPLSHASSNVPRRSWLVRWKPSWLVRLSSFFAAVFTIHRASGLWVWPVLLMFAWSSVAMRMMPVYESVTRLFFRSYEYSEKPPLDAPRHHPKLSWDEALAKGQAYMEDQAAQRGFTIEYPYILSHEPDFGFFRYQVKSSLDPSDRWCNTVVWMDSDTGAFSDFWAPTGLSSGSTFTTWLEYLHFGWVGGILYRFLIFVVGIVTAILCLTGVLMWWRKLKGRAGGQSASWIRGRKPLLVAADLLVAGGILVALGMLL